MATNSVERKIKPKKYITFERMDGPHGRLIAFGPGAIPIAALRIPDELDRASLRVPSHVQDDRSDHALNARARITLRNH
ncbi:hypothetical protein [Sphingomonas sp. 10B4]|uniref:hypothetical protein n=1 Tax=Sphingomonas sp. 10B4 TaxID=3048575 RepID=UPI002AB41637|nr:hypothetical protein [Sphingomonas sp. 10B4]MDY7523913.1 hypothetical protein [Sphingomonas sp. 10B4]